eukprot:PhF_6_TR6287/c0_g1_i1/m.9522
MDLSYPPVYTVSPTALVHSWGDGAHVSSTSPRLKSPSPRVLRGKSPRGGTSNRRPTHPNLVDHLRSLLDELSRTILSCYGSGSDAATKTVKPTLDGETLHVLESEIQILQEVVRARHILIRNQSAKSKPTKTTRNPTTAAAVLSPKRMVRCPVTMVDSPIHDRAVLWSNLGNSQQAVEAIVPPAATGPPPLSQITAAPPPHVLSPMNCVACIGRPADLNCLDCCKLYCMDCFPLVHRRDIKLHSHSNVFQVVRPQSPMRPEGTVTHPPRSAIQQSLPPPPPPPPPPPEVSTPLPSIPQHNSTPQNDGMGSNYYLEGGGGGNSATPLGRGEAFPHPTQSPHGAIRTSTGVNVVPATSTPSRPRGWSTRYDGGTQPTPSTPFVTSHPLVGIPSPQTPPVVPPQRPRGVSFAGHNTTTNNTNNDFENVETVSLGGTFNRNNLNDLLGTGGGGDGPSFEDIDSVSLGGTLKRSSSNMSDLLGGNPPPSVSRRRSFVKPTRDIDDVSSPPRNNPQFIDL